MGGGLAMRTLKGFGFQSQSSGKPLRIKVSWGDPCKTRVCRVILDRPLGRTCGWRNADSTFRMALGQVGPGGEQ